MWDGLPIGKVSELGAGFAILQFSLRLHFSPLTCVVVLLWPTVDDPRPGVVLDSTAGMLHLHLHALHIALFEERTRHGVRLPGIA